MSNIRFFIVSLSYVAVIYIMTVCYFFGEVRSLLEERLLCTLWFFLGKKSSKLAASAGVGELRRRLRGTAAILHIQILHKQNLKNTQSLSSNSSSTITMLLHTVYKANPVKQKKSLCSQTLRQEKTQ